MAAELNSFLLKFSQLYNDGFNAELNISCKQKKIRVNLNLDLDETFLPVIDHQAFQHHGHFPERAFKPSRVRRLRKSAEIKKPQSDAGTNAIMDTESIVRPAANHSIEESRN